MSNKHITGQHGLKIFDKQLLKVKASIKIFLRANMFNL